MIRGRVPRWHPDQRAAQQTESKRGMTGADARARPAGWKLSRHSRRWNVELKQTAPGYSRFPALPPAQIGLREWGAGWRDRSASAAPGWPTSPDTRDKVILSQRAGRPATGAPAKESSNSTAWTCAGCWHWRKHRTRADSTEITWAGTAPQARQGPTGGQSHWRHHHLQANLPLLGQNVTDHPSAGSAWGL